MFRIGKSIETEGRLVFTSNGVEEGLGQMKLFKSYTGVINPRLCKYAKNNQIVQNEKVNSTTFVLTSIKLLFLTCLNQC